MDPDYEEQRTPQSLADMLGLRDRGVEIGSCTNGFGSITISAPRLGCGVTTRSVVTAGRCGRWGMQRGRYRGGMLYEDADWHPLQGGNTSSASGSARTGGSSSCRRRPPAPQQQLRYTSLLDAPTSHPRPSSADSYLNESVESDQVLERWLQQPLVPTGQVPVEEEDVLPTYEEAIAQPASTRISVPLIAEAERQVPALITQHNHNHNHNHNPNYQHHQPRAPPSNSTRNSNHHAPPKPTTPALDHSCPSSSFSSRFTRLLRRRHSLDYVRPPPPQEGIPLELVTDKFGNRRRDLLWRERTGGGVAWFGNLENGGGRGGSGASGLPPRVLTRRGVRWEFD